MSAARTPGIWVATEKRATDGSGITYALYAGDVHIGSISLPTSGRMYVPDYYKVQEANAAFVVRACNSHDAMVKILNTTAGNIRSLGAAGALDQVPVPYRIWLEEVEKALTAAGAA